MLLLLIAHLVMALAAPLLVSWLGRRAFLVMALAPASALVWALSQTQRVLDGDHPVERVSWVPGLQMELAFRMDTLSWLLLLLVGGVGALVLVYCSAYFSASASGLRRFGGVLVAFAGAMVGLVTSDDMLVLFVFWELTTVFSYLLIGHYSDRKASRRAAMQAIVVTTAGGLALLGGVIVLGVRAGTFRLSEVVADPPAGTAATVAVVCVLLGAASKSALIPVHFWLPAAMAAPTPVSAYLHAAAMVKAGVYLVARFAPGFSELGAWKALVIALGIGTLVLGGYRALRQHDLKLILAFGTVSQLGLLILLVGVGTQSAALAGLAMIGAHAMFKASLFLVVGVVDAATGTRDFRRLTGLARALPWTAVAATLATASMIGLPPLAGFVAKEAALEAFVHDGTGLGPKGWVDVVVIVGVVLGSVLTFAYGLRFLWGAFATKRDVDRTGVTGIVRRPGEAPAGRPGERDLEERIDPSTVRRQSWLLVGPAVVLAVLGLAAALVPYFGEKLLIPYADTYPTGQPGHLALWAGVGPAFLLTVVIVVAGSVLFWQRSRVERLQDSLWTGPEADRVYRRTMRRLDDVASDVTARTQRGSLPFYLGGILVVLVVLPGGALLAALRGDDGSLLDVRAWDSPAQLLPAAVIMAAAILATRARRRLKAVLLVGMSGYGVAALFMLHGAPDLALTQILVETVTLVVFVLVLRRLPPYFSNRPLAASRWVRLGIGLAVGLTVAGFALIAPNARVHAPVSESFAEEAYAYGGGKNIVNVTLVDIRAWDTMGEISVLLVAATGVASLIFLRRRSGDILRAQDLEHGTRVWGGTPDPGAALRRRPPTDAGGGEPDRAADGRAVSAAAEAGARGPGVVIGRDGAGEIRVSPQAARRASAASDWLSAGRTLAPQRRSVIFEVVTRLLFHSMIVFSVFLLFSGHNAPGGGFAAGLVTGIALVVRYLAGGRYELGEAAPVHPGLLLGTGLFLSVGVGLLPLLVGGQVLQSSIITVSLPLLGTIKLVTSLFFDVGVYLVVVGLVLDILRSLGAEIDRHGESPTRGRDEDPGGDPAGEEPAGADTAGPGASGPSGADVAGADVAGAADETVPAGGGVPR